LRLTTDLDQNVIATPDGRTFAFAIDPRERKTLLEGLDEVDRTLAHEARIAAYEMETA
jgi:3-isopropylmalate/(R)-2-methylmalate dehydratase small subunit